MSSKNEGDRSRPRRLSLDGFTDGRLHFRRRIFLQQLQELFGLPSRRFAAGEGRIEKLSCARNHNISWSVDLTNGSDSHNFLHFSSLNISLGAESKINLLYVLQSPRIVAIGQAFRHSNEKLKRRGARCLRRTDDR